MRFHLIALPNVQTTKAYHLDGFCNITIRFARLLKDLGHTVILYASEENEAPCDELVTVISKDEQKVLLDGCPYQYAMADQRKALWERSIPRVATEIGRRKQRGDFMCSVGGLTHKCLADVHSDLMFVEFSVGYLSSFSNYRVFESQIWRHCVHGMQSNQMGKFFDEVIPMFFDEKAYPFKLDKEPFAVYVGRVIPNKGISVACKAAKLAGVPLKVIGHGEPKLVTDGAEYLGALSDEQRDDWVSRASCLICPTLYLEPFGAMAVEAQLCGTPVISTDFGGFVETVEQGKTGYRCKYLGEFVRGIKDAVKLDPTYIRSRAVGLYSMNKIKHDYQQYFERLNMLWDKGWDTL